MHGRDHRPGGADPTGPWDSTENVGTNWGVRSVAASAGDYLASDGVEGSQWVPLPPTYSPPASTAETFTGIPDSIATGAATDQRWTFNTGSTLVDLTNSRAPTVLAAGVYAVTANISVDFGVGVYVPPAGFWNASLALDALSSTTAIAQRDFIASDKSISLSCTNFIPLGGEILCGTGNETGSTFSFEMFSASIVKIT